MHSDFQVFIKPVGARCNLHCKYCYYLDKELVNPKSETIIMQDDVLEELIIQNIKTARGGEINFSWHGGEPLLAGPDFFKKAVGFQKKYAPSGCKITNGIQTNGILLNEEWCRFFAENDFYTGISLDGPENLHNKYRRYNNGKPSFNSVLKGLQLLQQHRIHHEILCVVNSENMNYPLEVYRFFKSLKIPHITFIPLVEKDSNSSAGVTEESVLPEKFGNFLITIFDEWLERDIGLIKIQIFEEALRTAFYQEHTLCIFKETCGRVPIVEKNGDFYSCDHFTEKQHLIGNITTTSLNELLSDPAQKDFGKNKLNSLPGYCLNCEVRPMCNGGCPKNRFIKTPNGEPGLNYLCKAYKLFFNHCKPFIGAVRAKWMNQ